MIFVLEYAPWAERDLRRLRRYLARRASYEIAEHYVTRLESYIAHARNGTSRGQANDQGYERLALKIVSAFNSSFSSRPFSFSVSATQATRSNRVLPLCGRPNDDFAHIHIVRLLDGKRDGAGDGVG